MRELEPMRVVRIVSTPSALDAAPWPAHAVVARVAPDEVFLLGGADPPELVDDDAIVEIDEGHHGTPLDTDDLEALAARCGWRFPDPPVVAQGAMLGIPIKVVFGATPEGLPILIVPSPFVAELLERLP